MPCRVLRVDLAAEYAGGASIDIWHDSSGNTRHFTCGGVNGPVFVANQLATLGGAEFDGVNDRLGNGIDYAQNDFTTFIVAKATTAHEIDAESLGGTSGVSGQHSLVRPKHGVPAGGGAGISFGTNGFSAYEHGDSYLALRAIGSQDFPSFQGQVYEFISFDRELTPQERADVVDYLNNNCGL